MRASVSDLDEFRKYLDDESYELETLVGRLRKQEPPSEQMLAGRALHSWLEHCDVGSADVAEWDGYKFIFSGDYELAITPIREMWCAKQYGDLYVRGRVDSIDGNVIEDHKTTSQFSPERYLGGFQWRYYLDMVGGNRFRWNVFVLYDVAPKTYDVKAIHPLEQVRYDGMAVDCERLAREFSAFSKSFLPERWTEAAAEKLRADEAARQ